MEQELLTILERLSSSPVLCGVHVIRSLVLCICLCVSFCPFSFGHWVVCPSSVYRFRLPRRVLKLFLKYFVVNVKANYINLTFKIGFEMCLACHVDSFPRGFDGYQQHFHSTGHQFTSRQDDVACV